jgi:cytochrome c oxidase subunit 1
MTYLIAVPTGIKFFNWIGTMWRGSLEFTTPMLFSVGFLVVFLFGGITGIFLASPPVDFSLHDTFFVVAHFHEVLFGTAVFGGFSGLTYWYPKITGRMLNDRLGKVSFWLMFIGFWLTFVPQYLLGEKGMPRRIAEYVGHDGWAPLNRLSTIGAYLLFLSVFVMLVNFLEAWRRPVPAGDNPWDAQTLEWATSSPPPHHNFYWIPPIRSERPLWDHNHPDHTVEREHFPRTGADDLVGATARVAASGDKRATFGGAHVAGGGTEISGAGGDGASAGPLDEPEDGE